MLKDDDWLRVPATVSRLFIKHAGEARNILESEDRLLVLMTEVGPVQLIKQAGKPFKPFFDGFGTASRVLGGPNPLVTGLLSGALSSGLGYGTGWLAEKLMPKKYAKRGVLPKNLAIAGGLVGGGLGAWAHGSPLVQEHGVKGMLMGGPFDHGKPGYMAKLLTKASQKYNIHFEKDAMFKHAAGMAGAFLPSIPVDHFNRMIMQDPFMPDPIRAATVGLTTAAGQAHGGAKLVSPFDVGRIAMGMGSGAISGMLVGKALGALAGLTTEAQQGIQRAGIMAGLLSNIVPRAFGR